MNRKIGSKLAVNACFGNLPVRVVIVFVLKRLLRGRAEQVASRVGSRAMPFGPSHKLEIGANAEVVLNLAIGSLK